MAIPKHILQDVASRIESASRPLIYYDDDADGLASFMLCHHANSDSIGVRAARGPELDADFARKVEENQPDLVLILDKPRVDPDFFKNVQTPTIWIDHHDPSTQQPHKWKYKHLTYINPRLHGRTYEPVSYWVYKILGGPLWIAATGTLADWDGSLLADMQKVDPTLCNKRTVKSALYNSPLGTLVRVFNFILKGSSKSIRKSTSALLKVHNPWEILHKTTPRGKFVHKHYEPVLRLYEQQRQEAMQTRVRKNVFCHIFSGLQTSLVAEVANEALITKNAAVIVVGRRVHGEIKFSMRSHQVNLPPILKKALKGVNGYGGGHKEACGGSISESDWDEFLSQIQEAVK